jgi:hypothetical protein
MSHRELSAVQHRSRAAAAGVREGYDGRTHYRAVMTALLPAAAILFAAATVLSRLLAA